MTESLTIWRPSDGLNAIEQSQLINNSRNVIPVKPGYCVLAVRLHRYNTSDVKNSHERMSGNLNWNSLAEMDWTAH